jgi:SAM-dependent methyltransferase
MDEARKGQVNRSAAEVYEEFFVPALFGPWADRVANAAGIGEGDSVLDVACGTGILAEAARRRAGSNGSVHGLDPNEGMLAVARRREPGIEWHQGVAESIPFGESRFDRVVSQFGLMFFEDPRKSLGEMKRVLRPEGRMAVAVWDALENTPGYAAMTGLLQRLFGSRAADALRAPFTLGDPEALRELFRASGIEGAEVETHPGTARFPSIRAWVDTDVKGWTLADLIDDEQHERLVREAEDSLGRFVSSSGEVAFDAPAHIVTAGPR